MKNIVLDNLIKDVAKKNGVTYADAYFIIKGYIDAGETIEYIRSCLV